MAHRPYPSRVRALRQLVRKERVVRRQFVTPAGALAEDYDFPGQSFQALSALFPSPPVDEYRMSTQPGIVSPGS